MLTSLGFAGAAVESHDLLSAQGEQGKMAHHVFRVCPAMLAASLCLQALQLAASNSAAKVCVVCEIAKLQGESKLAAYLDSNVFVFVSSK